MLVSKASSSGPMKSGKAPSAALLCVLKRLGLAAAGRAREPEPSESESKTSSGSTYIAAARYFYFERKYLS